MTVGFRFIVLEGIDGSGTTTQLQCLAQRLRADGNTVVTTSEPTPGPVGLLLRQALEGKLRTDVHGSAPFDWATLALLFAADRANHAQSLIVPTLAQGNLLLCDRYDLSSRIYQSVTADDPEAALAWLCTINERVPRPDLTLVLDIKPELAEGRRSKRGTPPELFEQNQLQRKLAQAYYEAEKYVPNDRLKHVRGELSISEVTDSLYAACVGSVE
jgi:dTMP kinase